ncbi:hypothetical protein ACFWOG_12445 [Kitasatospora sp. NPDC058406]|uniref:hypothetical protein n=1 Tax=Kitasatospora sp. NPDC058406 TaxID=3346483 RepID=UPI0036548869
MPAYGGSGQPPAKHQPSEDTHDRASQERTGSSTKEKRNGLQVAADAVTLACGAVELGRELWNLFGFLFT